jgi:hypothetical protein
MLTFGDSLVCRWIALLGCREQALPILPPNLSPNPFTYAHQGVQSQTLLLLLLRLHPNSLKLFLIAQQELLQYLFIQTFFQCQHLPPLVSLSLVQTANPRGGSLQYPRLRRQLHPLHLLYLLPLSHPLHPIIRSQTHRTIRRQPPHLHQPRQSHCKD